MTIWAVDSENTKLVDDAFSLSLRQGILHLDVYIAAPGLYMMNMPSFFEEMLNHWATPSWYGMLREHFTYHPDYLLHSLDVSKECLHISYTRSHHSLSDGYVTLSNTPTISRVASEDLIDKSSYSNRSYARETVSSVMKLTNQCLSQWCDVRDIPLLHNKPTRSSEPEPSYAGFTSPLRKFPDLVNQIQILSYLSQGRARYSDSQLIAWSSRWS